MMGTWNKVPTIVVAAAILVALVIMGYTMAVPKQGEKVTEFYLTGPGDMIEKYPVEFTLDDNGKVVLVNYITMKYADPGYEKKISESTGRVILTVVNREQQQMQYTVKLTIGGKPGPMEVKQDGEWKQYNELTFYLNDGEKGEYEVGFAPTEICGSTTLTSPAQIGQNELRVKSVSHFDVGDYILVGTAGSDELVQIAAVNEAQSMIVLETALAIYDQPVESTVIEQKKAEFALYKSGEDKPYLTLHLWIHVTNKI